MKKFLVLIIITLVAASPYAVGWYSKFHYDKDIAQLAKIYNGRLKIVGSYVNGYMTSKAKTEVISMDNKPVFSLTHNIQHGPIIFNFNGWLNPSSYIPQDYKLAVVKNTIDSSLTKALTSLYGKPNFYECVAKFAYSGDASAYIKVMPLTMPLQTGTVVWSGLTLNGARKSGSADLNMDVLISSIDYKNLPAELSKEIKTSNLKMSMLFNLYNLNINYNLAIDSLILTQGTAEVFKLTAPSIKFVAHTEKDDLKRYELTLNFNKLKVEQEEVGPFDLFLKLSNVNQDLLKQAAQPPDANTQSTSIGDLKFNLPPEKALQFFSAQPSIDIDFKFTTSKGTVKYSASTTIGGKNLTKLDQPAVVATASVKSSLEIDKVMAYEFLSQYLQDQIYDKQKEFFDKNPPATKNPYLFSDVVLQSTVEDWVNNLLDNLKAENLIAETDNQLTMHLEFNNQKLTVNDKEISNDSLEKIKVLMDFKVDGGATVVPVTPAENTITTTTDVVTEPLAPAVPEVVPNK